jgi:hypothetical protein
MRTHQLKAKPDHIQPPRQVMSRSGFPCFQGGGDRAVRALGARFAPGLSEGQVVQHVLGLIGGCLVAWLVGLVFWLAGWFVDVSPPTTPNRLLM